MQNKTQGEHSIDCVLKTCTAMLASHVPMHALEARVLLGHALCMSEKDIILHGTQTLSQDTHDSVFKLIDKRLQGIPLAYLTGIKEFYGRCFFVNADVLIPRAETELVVEQALACNSTMGSTILDLGTGSGCIGITLAAELDATHKTAEECSVLLADNSTHALRLAQKNAETILGVERTRRLVRLCHWDLRDPWETMRPYMHEAGTKEPLRLEDIGLFVANLPYVAPHEYQYAYSTLMHEPYGALVGNGADGFFFIRTLLERTARLKHKHTLVLECDPLHIDAVLAHACNSHYTRMRIAHDVRGYPRVCVLSHG